MQSAENSTSTENKDKILILDAEKDSSKSADIKAGSVITVKNLRKVYKLGKEKVVALNNINLEIKKGEICCILGVSGSGKSTLLNMLAGLEKPSKGEILINRQRIDNINERKLAIFRQKYIGFIFQSFNLIPTLTALENVAMPLVFRGVKKSERIKLSKSVLKMVGLGKHIKHRPTQMSGGQQQRVGIARAFVSKPSVIFADEPTGNLDSKTTVEVMNLMIRICRENNQTLILVTHDVNIANYSDRVIKLFDGDVISDYIVDHSALPENTEEQQRVSIYTNDGEEQPENKQSATVTETI